MHPSSLKEADNLAVPAQSSNMKNSEGCITEMLVSLTLFSASTLSQLLALGQAVAEWAPPQLIFAQR